MAVRAVREIGYHRFDRCPTCFVPEPSTREHVPPAAIGGNVKTSVCHHCNSDLGSRIEVDLLDWRDDAVRRPRISGGPAHRRAPFWTMSASCAGVMASFSASMTSGSTYCWLNASRR